MKDDYTPNSQYLTYTSLDTATTVGARLELFYIHLLYI